MQSFFKSIFKFIVKINWKDKGKKQKQKQKQNETKQKPSEYVFID